MMRPASTRDSGDQTGETRLPSGRHGSAPWPDPDGATLLRNILRFGRSLRLAGLPVTVTQVADLSRALTWIDVADPDQFFMTARAVLVTRREDLALFTLVFRRFWTGPGEAVRPQPKQMPRAPRHDAVQGRFTIVNYMAFKADQAARELDVGDRSGTWADIDVLRTKRFADMTPEEIEAVSRLLRELRWSTALRKSRRRVRSHAGRMIDYRRVLRHAARLGALPARLPRRRRLEKERPLVLIADISGSMEKYSRLVLQFFHSAVRAYSHVETFVFATRLTRITTQLRLRNIDRAIAEAARDVSDWAGGTRIGDCLRTFNREWSRRVLRRGAIVAIISDGCDRGDADALRREMRYLGHRCHRLVWLNPHLGHPGYSPEVAGMRAALDYVDEFLPVDDIPSLEIFVRTLGRGAESRSGRPGRRGA